MKRRKILIPLLSSVILLCLCSVVTPQILTSSCTPRPTRPAHIATIDQIITDLGGLPATNIDLHNSTQVASAEIRPVTAWENTHVLLRTNRPFWQNILDDDPTYHYQITFLAHYADGDSQHFKWSSWRYGLITCPGILPLGDGPPGSLTPLSEKAPLTP